APPTATSAPQAAAKPAPTSIPAAAPAATSAPAAAPTSAPAAKPAPTSAPASAAAGAGGELVVGKDQEGPGLDPAKNPAQAAIRIFDLMYSRLTRLDAQMRPQADLAEKWDISAEDRKSVVQGKQRTGC